jgi:hypothetical protein
MPESMGQLSRESLEHERASSPNRQRFSSRRQVDRISELGLACLAVGLLVWVELWQYSLYVGTLYNYHDLTLITDWFSNALVHGRPFWITDGHRSHLTIHFTPALILLTPAFAFFHEQYALPAIVAFTVCAGIYLAARDQRISLTRLSLASTYLWILTIAFFIVVAENRYTARIISSAHFEPVFVLAAALLLHRLRSDAGYWQLGILLVLALGIRQDAGLYLFFLLISCLVAPSSWGRPRPRKVAVLAAACVVYVVVVAGVVMPRLGDTEGTRFWHLWGSSWPQVFLAWLTSPGEVFRAIESSDFGEFNRAFLYLPLLNPLAWLANQLPSILFYTADAPDKRALLFYNASFLLPGMMLCFAFAQLHAVAFVTRHTHAGTALRHVGLIMVCAVFAYAAFDASTRVTDEPKDKIAVTRLTRNDPFAFEPLRGIVNCRNVHSVAADFHNVIYVPLRLDKYLLPNADKADVVVIPREFDAHMPASVRREDVLRGLPRALRYSLVASVPDFDVYARSTAACKPSEDAGAGT